VLVIGDTVPLTCGSSMSALRHKQTFAAATSRFCEWQVGLEPG
jgi:hypothetical protein